MKRDRDDGVKVLIVDDDRSIRSLLAIACSVEEGIGEVQAASDGLEAVATCARFAPDVVFLDYWMPAADGAATAAEIRRVHPDARIVAFSGVLQEKPPWADDLVVKGQMPDLASVVKAVRD